MKLSFYAAFAYLVLGLLGGVFYREFTKYHDFPPEGYTQLSVVHTHLLMLGFVIFLLVLLLDSHFHLSGRFSFAVFFGAYNLGLVIMVAMLLVHGTMSVLGVAEEDVPSAVAWIAGTGHMLLATGLVALMLALKDGIEGKPIEEDF